MLVFYLLIFIAACLLVLLLSALYKPIGNIAHKLLKDAKDNIVDEDNETKTED